MARIRTSVAFTTKDGADVAVGAIELESNETKENYTIRGDDIVGEYDKEDQTIVGNGGNKIED